MAPTLSSSAGTKNCKKNVIKFQWMINPGSEFIETQHRLKYNAIAKRRAILT